jgi:DNA-binding transcriptional ArsR family regulator
VSSAGDIEVLDDPGSAAALVRPLPRRILEELREAGSSSSVAKRLGLPRQKVNYHLRKLEEEGLVVLVEERRRGNCVERVVRASARSYFISPQALGSLDADPGDGPDAFSPSRLISLASRMARDVAALRDHSRSGGPSPTTLSLETEVVFRSAADREAFAVELAETLGRLTAKYHDERKASAGHPAFRLVVAGYLPASP